MDESFDPTAAQDQQVSELRQIKINQIYIDVDQPRKKFDDDELADLAASISEHGVLQPIIVAPSKDGYQIVAGERRYPPGQAGRPPRSPVVHRRAAG